VCLEANGDNIYNQTTDILQKLLGNLLANPEEAKFRTVKLSNAKIHAAIVAAQGALDILKAAGFAEADNTLTIAPEAPLAAVQEALTAVQLSISARAAAKSAKVVRADDRARQAYLDEQARKKAENDKRKAQVKAKIQGQQKEEKEYTSSVSQHKGFGAGTKESASQLGAGGNTDGGG